MVSIYTPESSGKVVAPGMGKAVKALKKGANLTMAFERGHPMPDDPSAAAAQPEVNPEAKPAAKQSSGACQASWRSAAAACTALVGY